jgi:hypothetical protein
MPRRRLHGPGVPQSPVGALVPPRRPDQEARVSHAAKRRAAAAAAPPSAHQHQRPAHACRAVYLASAAVFGVVLSVILASPREDGSELQVTPPEVSGAARAPLGRRQHQCSAAGWLLLMLPLHASLAGWLQQNHRADAGHGGADGCRGACQHSGDVRVPRELAGVCAAAQPPRGRAPAALGGGRSKRRPGSERAPAVCAGPRRSASTVCYRLPGRVAAAMM